MSVSYSLYKRSNGVFYIGFTEHGHRRWKSTGTSNKSDALKALTNLEKLLEKPVKQKLLSDFLSDFLSYAEVNFSSKTHQMYESSLNRFLKVIGNRPLSQITVKEADIYKTERLKKSLSGVSVNIELRTLKAAFNVALRWRELKTNPFQGIKQVKMPEQQPTYLSKEDFQKLILIIKENWLKELIIFAVLTGLRRGELVNLRWQDVDLKKRSLTIQSSLSFRTKYGKMRTIPLSEVAYQILLAKQNRAFGEYVFTLNGKRVMDTWISHKFKYYVYEAKLDNDKLHFHSLRHTFASWLVQDGVNIYEVQKLLGHSSIKVTEVYSHLASSELRNAVDRINLELN
jgi:site-specific recombinase XerD